MATNYTEKERAFVASLDGDTGSDLAGWMRAIEFAGLDGRNAIIDWLRQQGFTFANASWLERIHHNGGKLIYGDGETTKAALVSAPNPDIEPPPPLRNFKTSNPQPRPPAAPIQMPKVSEASSSDMASLLAAAKGLRPLAEAVMGEIQRAVPGSNREPDSPFVIFKAPLPFLALLLSPKELRLYGDFGGAGGLGKRAEASKRFTPPFPDVVILNDARQVTAVLTETVRTAHARING